MRLAVLLVIATSSVAHARDVVVYVDDPPGLARAAVPPRALYLNRCVGGCTVRPGENSAADDRSSIIDDTYTLTEFAYSDTIWDAVVTCVREKWAPYDLEIVTEEPDDGTPYTEVMVAGDPSELGQSGNTLGIAPMSTSCTPNSDWIAFAFANAHGTDPVQLLCETTAHEAGHTLGLDHEYDCKDTMTYLSGCSAKWFLDIEARCGEFEQQGPRDCKCTGETQNTHRILIDVLGPGALPSAPGVMIPYPADQAAVIDGFTMFGLIDEPRILDRVEFWLNGWPWSVQAGVREVETYSYAAPGNLPDGIIDLEVKAFNDLQLEGSLQITVTKGEPCTSASTCLDGQSCDDGRCAWPPPTGELGDACELDADCVTRRCGSDGEVNLCTEYCQLGVEGACADGYSCLRAGDDGLCWPSDRIGGCCSAGGGGAGEGALAGLVLALIAGTGRRRSARRSRS